MTEWVDEDVLKIYYCIEQVIFLSTFYHNSG